MVGADGVPGPPVDVAPGLPVGVAPGPPVGVAPGPPVEVAPRPPVDVPAGLPVDVPAGEPLGGGPPVGEDELIDGAAPDARLVSAGDDGLIGGDVECSTAGPVSCSDEETSPEPGVDRRLVPADLGGCVIFFVSAYVSPPSAR